MNNVSKRRKTRISKGYDDKRTQKMINDVMKKKIEHKSESGKEKENNRQQ